MSPNALLYQPTSKMITRSRLADFRSWLADRKGITPGGDYEDLWKWSVENVEEFWLCVSEYFEVGTTFQGEAMSKDQMPDVRWFEGLELNFAEHVFAAKTNDYPALICMSERKGPTEISWNELESNVARLASYLKSCGLSAGDRVGAFLPNIPEATYGFLAANSLGCIWSSCSPDFGAGSVIDRLKQIEPRVLLTVDGYQYGGKKFDRLDVVAQIVEEIASIEQIVVVPYLHEMPDMSFNDKAVSWVDALYGQSEKLSFVKVPFDHPIWVLYSSGTTGVPKAITHSHGGILLEHLKYLAFHNDLKRGEKFFWFSTTGWMMWNYIQGALLHGGTVVLYDGSPGYPDLGVLWKMASEIQLEHFGTSAPYLVACMKEGLAPGRELDLSHLRTVSSTGAPLPPEAFDWVYENVKKDVWLCSMSGGTDVCTAFVGGCPEKPVYRGEIQCRALGVDLCAFDEAGRPVIDQLGEMVIRKPMPSMPVFFWGDNEKERYRSSYFEKYPGVWRHGDWVKLTDKGGLMIFGRSDATLNRQGVRIGTAEIYRALHGLTDIKDALIIHLDNNDRDFMPLFIVLADDILLDDELRKKIKSHLRKQCSPRHVPDTIIEIPEVPYTMSGKKMEAPVKKLLQGGDPEKVLNKDAMRNPQAINFFIDFKPD